MRPLHRPRDAEELSTVAGPCRLLSGQVGEHDLVGVLCAPRVANEQCVRLGVVFGHEVIGGVSAVLPEDDLGVPGDGERRRPRSTVREPEPRDLERIVARDELHEVEVESEVRALMKVPGHAEAVAGDVPTLRKRPRCGRAERPVGVVAHVDRL